MSASVTKVRLQSDFGPTEVTDSPARLRSVLEVRTLPRIFRHLPSLTRKLAIRQSAMSAALLIVATSVVLSACASGSPVTSPSTTARRSTSATKPPTGAAASALAAYRAMWANMATASLTSDYQSPLLSDHASGEALSVLVQGVAENQSQGIVTKGEPVLHPQVTSLTPAGGPTQATITDCFDARHWLDYKTSGGLANSTPGGKHATTAIVLDTSGAWKVTQLAVQAAGTC